jgi:hypothetical protein
MKLRIALLLLCSVMVYGQSAPVATSAGKPAPEKPAAHQWAVVLHGGAGVMERARMTPEREAAYRAGLNEALQAAASVLNKGGSSLDAIEAAIQLLEDNPLFNAGAAPCLPPMAPINWTRPLWMAPPCAPGPWRTSRARDIQFRWRGP